MTPPAVMPPLPCADYADEENCGTEVEFRKGMVCPRCGCCAPRAYWDRWECPNERCKYRHYVNMLPYPLSSAREEEKRPSISRVKAGLKPGELLKDNIVTRLPEVTFESGFVATTYHLPDPEGKIIGSVTIFRATEQICMRENGPDELYRDLQAAVAIRDKDDNGQVIPGMEKSGKINLRRNPVRNPGRKWHPPFLFVLSRLDIANTATEHIEVLTRHFQQNFVSCYSRHYGCWA